jgi:hypothetical protein
VGEIGSRDLLANANVGATEARDVFLSHANTSAIEAVCRLMMDSLDLETLMNSVLGRGLVGVDDFADCGTRADERGSLAFGRENCRDRMTVALPDHNNNPALAVLVPSKTTVAAAFFLMTRASSESLPRTWIAGPDPAEHQHGVEWPRCPWPLIRVPQRA